MGIETAGDGTVTEVQVDGWDVIAALYRIEQPGLVRLAHLLVRDQAVAEELVQDAFLLLHPHLDGTEKPGAYLRTTVVNLCLTTRASRSTPSPPLGFAGPSPPSHLLTPTGTRASTTCAVASAVRRWSR